MADTLVSAPTSSGCRQLSAPRRRCSALLQPGCYRPSNTVLRDTGSGKSAAAPSRSGVQLENGPGPCLDCYRSGRAVSVENLATAHDRWPLFAREAVDAGFQSVHALPMRLREQCIGTLNLFRVTAGPLNEADVRVGQALADVATIGILQERAVRRSEVLAEQLQTALNSRIVIEQAKGMLAEHAASSVQDAFAVLRSFARDTNQRLSDVALDLVTGRLPAGQVLDHRSRRR